MVPQQTLGACVSFNYYTEWNKSEREKQIYINTYIWNLERRWTFMQGSYRDIDIESRLVDTMGEGEGEMGCERSMEA